MMVSLGQNHTARLRRRDGQLRVTVFNPHGIAIGLFELPQTVTVADAIRKAKEHVVELRGAP